MAKRRKKGHRKGRRRKGYVFTAARRRALKKAQRARKRRHGGKRKRRHGGRRKRRHGRKTRSRRRRGRRHGGSGVRHGAVYERMYAKAISRGRSPALAAKVAARAARMRAGSARRYFEREAVQAKSAAQLSNLFSGFGAAGRAHHAMG